MKSACLKLSKILLSYEAVQSTIIGDNVANRKIEPAEKIAKLEQLEQEIKAKLKREKARIRTAEKEQAERRFVIVGKLALNHKDPAFQQALSQLLADKLKPEERALFDLPEPETPPPS